MKTTLTIRHAEDGVCALRIDGIWRDASGFVYDSHDAAGWDALASGEKTDEETYPGAFVVAADPAAHAAEIAKDKADRRRANALYWARRRG